MLLLKSTGVSGGSTPDFQAGAFGVRSLSRYQCTFSKYFNRGSGASEPTLNCRTHHNKEVSDLQGRGSTSRGKLLGGCFWVILRDLFVVILEYSHKLIHTYIHTILWAILAEGIGNFRSGEKLNFFVLNGSIRKL